MSRHKLVKNLDLDDELDDFDGDYDDEYDDELTPQDKESLRKGLISVRDTLGPDFPATDREIEGSLYHYYYDVEKTVNYLLGQKSKGQSQKKPKTNSDTKQSSGPSPDDVVLKAQNSKGAKGTTVIDTKGSKAVDSSANGLSQSISDISIMEKSKVKSKNLDVAKEYEKSEHKNATSFVVIGHVDAGKSTLMGRVLHDLKVVDQRTMDKYRRESSKIGKSSFALAWVLDESTEERARGVTIDIATQQFATSNTLFTILDAPGHRDFIPNMIAGAAQADFALLVIDADTGNFESGLKGQTKEHVLLVRSTGVQRIVVAVNKLDAVQWSEDRFREIQQQLSAFLTTTGFLPKNVTFIPCSGLTGDNIVNPASPSSLPGFSWYKGATLLAALEPSPSSSSSSTSNNRALDKPFRLTIDDVSRSPTATQATISVIGRIDQGTCQIGDAVLALPASSQQQTAPMTIKALTVDGNNNDIVDWAVAGQSATLHLVDVAEPKALRQGDVVCLASAPVPCVKEFTMKLLAFEHVLPMQVEVLRGRLNAPGKVKSLVAVLDKSTGAVVTGSAGGASAGSGAGGSDGGGGGGGSKKAKKTKKPRLIKPGEVARIVVEVEEAVPLEVGNRVVLRAGGESVGAGLVE